jgi:hypothetical protein
MEVAFVFLFFFEKKVSEKTWAHEQNPAAHQSWESQ